MDANRGIIRWHRIAWYQEPKQTQFNTVVVQQEEMDRVGFEPTTPVVFTSYLEGQQLLKEREMYCSNSAGPTFIFAYSIDLIVKWSFEKSQSQ